MRMSDLEKEAGLGSFMGKKLYQGVEGFGKGVDWTVKLPFRGLNTLLTPPGEGSTGALRKALGRGVWGAAKATGKGVVGAGKAALPIARGAASYAVNNPLKTGFGVLTAQHMGQQLKPIATGEMYLKKMRDVGNRGGGYYTGGTNSLFKSGEELMEKKSSFVRKEIAGVLDDLRKNMIVNTMLASGALGTGLYTIFQPTLKTYGERLQRQIHPLDARIGAEDEVAKKRVSHLGDYEGKQMIKDKERAMKQKLVLPSVKSVVENIRGADPIVHEAWKTPELKKVINQAMDTVYSFAPSVASDPRAMQSVLREAVTSPEGGLSFQTIKQLAETQKAVSDG